ncbi:protein-export chaperone SecB [Glutamicibacter halophytocola]|uniref:Protein-export chaperone SecB n=1 Tax=Glutamicibacter halophytocola TaxID=1933880 RepID=A0AA95BSM0_9MICC|nr:protein-export chaperone SecB [Glutamicibacter halophytocola]UUX60194.1 protein-export chaperone SecB [Glutamicibacter halophytocola]
MTDERQVAARLAAHAEMIDVRMVQASFEHQEFPDPGTIDYELHISPEARMDDSSSALVTSAKFIVDMKQDSDGETIDIAHIEFVFAGMYKMIDKIHVEDEEVKAFANTTGVFALYPYAREYVQDVTSRLGLPSLTLGLYKIPTDGPDQ